MEGWISSKTKLNEPLVIKRPEPHFRWPLASFRWRSMEFHTISDRKEGDGRGDGRLGDEDAARGEDGDLLLKGFGAEVKSMVTVRCGDPWEWKMSQGIQ